MFESLKKITEQINKIDSKLKKHVDIIYLIGVVLLVIQLSCSIVFLGFSWLVSVLLPVSFIIHFLVSLYRIVVQLAKDYKKSLLAIAVTAFSFLYFSFSGNDFQFPLIALAIVGAMGVSGNKILISGMFGNLIMIISNFCAVFFSSADSIYSDCQERTFFYFGENTFSIPRYKFNSLTDFAALFFWMTVTYLWIRGKRLTWCEFFALCAFDALTYSLTASNTSLLCMTFVLFIVFACKICQTYKFSSKILDFIKKTVEIGGVLSFLFFSGFCIFFSYIFDVADPLSSRINKLLHYRLGLGHRGLVDYGIHLFSSKVESYGVYTSADGYYFFLDCSYVSLLVTGGVLFFLFYVCSYTVLQYRNRKNLYRVLLLTVCAISCVQEHHLSELPFGIFILLLFADMNFDTHTGKPANNSKTSIDKAINFISIPICAIFLMPVIILNCTKLKSIKNLDRLDERAGKIYANVQANLNALNDNVFVMEKVNSMNSLEYGDVLSEPSDYLKTTGLSWDKAVSDPKVHSYFSIYYDSYLNSKAPAIIEYLVTDTTQKLIGDGSIVIEYDISARKVYSIWYSDKESCRVISGGRTSDRTARLKHGVLPEGYSTGK